MIAKNPFDCPSIFPPCNSQKIDRCLARALALAPSQRLARPGMCLTPSLRRACLACPASGRGTLQMQGHARRCEHPATRGVFVTVAGASTGRPATGMNNGMNFGGNGMNGYGGGNGMNFGGNGINGFGNGMNFGSNGMNGFGNGMNFGMNGYGGGNGMNFSGNCMNGFGNGMNGFGNGMNFGGMNFGGNGTNGRYAGGAASAACVEHDHLIAASSTFNSMLDVRASRSSRSRPTPVCCFCFCAWCRMPLHLTPSVSRSSQAGWSGFDDSDGPPGHMRVPDWRFDIQPRFAPVFMQQARRADPLNAASELRM